MNPEIVRVLFDRPRLLATPSIRMGLCATIMGIQYSIPGNKRRLRFPPENRSVEDSLLRIGHLKDFLLNWFIVSMFEATSN